MDADHNTTDSGASLNRLEKSRAEEALRLSEENYRFRPEKEGSVSIAELYERNQHLTEAQALGHIGNFYFDLNRDSVYWSDELYRIMGFEPGEGLTFEKAISVYLPGDRVKLERLTANSLESGSGFELEAEFIPYGKSDKRCLFLKAEPVSGQDGKGAGIKGIVQDVTLRKRAEEKIQELNNTLVAKNRELESLNSELTTLNSIAANDYGQTLQSLYTNLEFVIRNDAHNLSNVAKANMRKAQTAIQKLKLLTEDIVAFSKLPDMDQRAEGVDLDALLEGVIGDMEDKIAESGLVIERSGLPTVSCFPLLVSILFHHLIDNAQKFRASHPKLQIVYERTSEGTENPPLQYHRIRFRDNGIGFEQQHAESIFTIFCRLHERQTYKGSGVGLAVCRKIMDLHGGFMTAHSVPGKGSEFSCYFPLK